MATPGQAESTFSSAGVQCNLIPLHVLNRNSSPFLWLKSSIQQDRLVAKHKDGSFSVLKVRDKGSVSSYVLDPNLRCVFWDYENASEHRQLLFAQASNGDVLLYAVDDDGVTETLRIPYSKLASVANISTAQKSDYKEKLLELAGCDRGHIVLCLPQSCLVCISLTATGSMHLTCTLSLPQAGETSGTKPDSKDSVDNHDMPSQYQIVNGSVVICHHDAYVMSTYSLPSGHHVSDLDLNPLVEELGQLINWRFSDDLGKLMLLLKEWVMICVNVKDYSLQFPSCYRPRDVDNPEGNFGRTYRSLSVSHYEDAAWRQELTNQHASLVHGSVKKDKTSGSSVTTGQPVGFKIQRKHAQKDVTATFSTSWKTTIQLEEGERKHRWRLDFMEASSDVLTLVLSRESTSLGDSNKKAICFASFVDHMTQLHHLDDSTSVVLSGSTTCSHILWSDGHLMFISPHTKLQKDDLIAWMMSYSGPNSADSLCQVNKWTRAAVPLHALGSSLHQRQLDTIAFYFKSKQNLFSLAAQSQQSLVLAAEIRQCGDTLQLVTSAVTSCITDPQGRIFAERLLSLTLDFVYGLLEDARQVSQNGDRRGMSTDFIKETEKGCNILLSHIPALRKCMRALSHRASQIRGGMQVHDEKKKIQTSFDIKSEKSLEDFVKENNISSFQARLMSDSGSETRHYRELVAELLDLVKQHLERKDISACQHILNNLGCDVPSTLWSLAQFYASRTLQQFITGQLGAAVALSSSQRQIVQYLEQLYKSYPCASFNTAMKSKIEDKNGTWPDKEDPLQDIIFAGDTFLLSHCGELTHKSDSELPGQSSGGLYVSIVLAWLVGWSEDMKQSVILDARFMDSGDVRSDIQSDPSSAWQYLISHGMLVTILSLLKSKDFDAHRLVPANITDHLHLGWSHLRREMARALIKLGKLNLESATAQGLGILSLLPTVGGPIKKPHPLSYVGSPMMNRIHSDFIAGCISTGLQLPLWMYCSVHGISPSEINVSQGCSWFVLFQKVYSIPRHPTDRTLMLSASLLAASDLLSSAPGEMNVEMMLERNQILAAVGTLSYMSEEDHHLNASTVERYLSKFPKLVSALLPENCESSAKQNTTVYQLLLGTAPFDMRRLFGWQSTNTFADEDSTKVMPHFSESETTSSHSRHRKLAFPYYLKHGRPVYAFLSFLCEELDRKDATLSVKRIQQACGAALWIACQNFNTCHIASSCVVFVELLGRDSALVRAMIQAGRLLFSHRHRNIGGGAEARQEQLKECVAQIVSELQACIRSHHRHGSRLIKSLEAAIKEEIKLEGIESCSFEACHKWMLVIMLCHLLGLPQSTCFLQACAERDNWLMFVWFSQLHQYPTHQLQAMLHFFTSEHLRDHLHYVLNNADCRTFSSAILSSPLTPSVGRTSNDQKSSQNQRSSLYNKIGLQRLRAYSSSEEEEDKSGHAVISSFSSRLKQAEFNESEMPESAAPEDVFQMLFHSRSMPSQWRCLLAASVSLGNPLFAELAACCGCPAIPSVCGWLLASLNPQVKQDLLNVHGQLISKWTLEHLEAVIQAVLMAGQEDVLTTAFIILQPLSPLLPFLHFVRECLKRGNYAASKTYIDQFKDAMASSESQKSSRNIASDVQTIGDRMWFEKVTYEVLRHELKMVCSLYHARHLLEILDKHNMCLLFSFDVLDFAKLHRIINLLHVNSVPDIHLPTLLTSGTGSRPFVSQCEAAIDHMIRCGNFSQAQELAKVAGISREKVTISQLKEEKQKLVNCGMWSAKFVRAQYWNKCRKLIQRTKCSLETCALFFEDELRGTSAELEKAVLCQHWFGLLEERTTLEASATKDLVFREMWRHRIAAKVALEEVDSLDQVFDEVSSDTIRPGDLKTDLLQVTLVTQSGSDESEDLSAQELEVLDSLMGSYLDKGRISACSEVASVFGHYNQDLAIIQTCISLASKQSTIENIEPAMRRLVAKNSNKRVRATSITMSRSFSVSSISSQAEASSLVNENLEIISVMEKLFVHCNKGSQVCLRVITCFKIAEMLELEYKDVVVNPPFDSLRQLLQIQHPNKFAVARDFLATSGLSDAEVTGFLADSIVSVLKMYVKGGSGPDSDLDVAGRQHEPMLRSSDGMEVFSQFLKLCENTALLGDHILQAVASVLSGGPQEMSAAVLTIQTELIIMAHECYTVSSSMEGISHVLRAARVCCDCIAEAQEYSLMIRLLTGVGRYSEMLYIFHALQQHHQFELLLRKGMDREDKLKVAILDYLKRYQPEDSEAYTMVALKFTMYRDIAAMLEVCGQRSLKHFKDKPLENSKETQELLKKCLQYFRDAAESYVKDNSVRKAQHCVRQARLLSLQLQLLASGVSVINLNRSQVVAFINTHGRFIESMVVSDAYDHRADWADAIFNNVIVNGDMRFLQELRLHVHVTSTLVEDVVKRYKQAPSKASSGLAAVKKLLTLVKDVQLQYKLASELGLTDMVTALLKGDTGSYLQDVTVVL